MRARPTRLRCGAGCLLALALLAAGCSGTREVTTGPPTMSWKEALRSIDAALTSPGHAHAFWGVTVVNLETGETLVERNADLNMIPASNTKLYTTAAALVQLGPDFVFETTVSSDGLVRNDTLFGDLFVRGSGDPTIGGRFTDGDELAYFRGWASELRALGITHVTGDVVGDDDFFDDVHLGYGWSWDDEPYWYSAELGALSFNDNCVDFTVTGGSPGTPATVSWRPMNTTYIDVDNRTLTVADDSLAEEEYTRARASNTVIVSSRIAPGATAQESISISNPTAFFVHVLRDVLESEGIAVGGAAVDIDTREQKPEYSTHRVLIRHASRPLADIVAVINKRSQNLYADQVLKTLGALLTVSEDVDPGSSAAGIEVAEATWAAAGVDTSTVQIVDGSGLSRYNLTTPRSTARLLQHMWDRPEPVRNAFFQSLPIGGVDGTLAGRYADGRSRGLVRAKTGTVSNVSTLSGYVRTAAGTPLAFSLMCNNFVVDTDEIRTVQDRVVEALASVRDR